MTIADHGQADTGPASWQRWAGFCSLLMGVVSLSAFLALFSTSVQIPKALVYGGDLLAWTYLNLPTIYGFSGLAAVLLALAALSGSRSTTKLALIGLVVGVGLFVALMVVIAGAMAPSVPQAPLGKSAPLAVSVVLALTAPAVATFVPLLGLAAMLLWLPGISGRRPAVAGLILGGCPWSTGCSPLSCSPTVLVTSEDHWLIGWTSRSLLRRH